MRKICETVKKKKQTQDDFYFKTWDIFNDLLDFSATSKYKIDIKFLENLYHII